MRATLEVNSERADYPEEVHHLEGLLFFVMNPVVGNKKIVTEVKVDGTLYSEPYPHQAREIRLDQVGTIAVETLTEEAFAEAFLKQGPAYVDQLEAGFKTASSLLRIPLKEAEGFQLLGWSVEALRGFKTHLENVEGFLQKGDAGREPFHFWTEFEALIDQILISQEQREVDRIAELLEKKLIPFLRLWRDRFTGSGRA